MLKRVHLDVTLVHVKLVVMIERVMLLHVSLLVVFVWVVVVVMRVLFALSCLSWCCCCA